MVEVGLGLGVFAGDVLGIGNSVRQLSVGGNSVVEEGEVRRNFLGMGIIGIYMEYIHHVIHWMTSSSPSWRSLNHLQGSRLTIPKRLQRIAR